MNKTLVLVVALLSLVVITVIGYLLHHYPVLNFIDETIIGDAIESMGWLGIPGFIIFGALFTSLGLPRQIVAFIAGYLYGIVIGIVLGTVATVMGAMLTFNFSRWLARPFVLRKYPAQVAKIDAFICDKLFAKIILVRFLPFGTNLATNLAAGATDAPARSFALASAIGFIPQMTIFALSGNGMQVESNLQLILAIGLFCISIIIGVVIYRQRSNGASSALNI